MTRGALSEASTSTLGATSVSGRMHPADLEALADLVAVRVAEHLAAPPAAGQLVDAETLAGLLGVTRGYVYEHADALGAQRLGNGPRPRLRFDVAQAREWAARLPGGEVPASEDPLVPARHRRLRRPRGSGRVPAPVPTTDDREVA